MPNFEIVTHQNEENEKKFQMKSKRRIFRQKKDLIPEKKRANRPKLRGRRKRRNGGENENGEEGRKRKEFKGFLKTETWENQMPCRGTCQLPANQNVAHGHQTCSAVMSP